MEHKHRITDPIVTDGSGNIFEDLNNLPDPEVLLIKAELVRQLEHAVRDHDWTQAEAATATGLTQSQISRLVRGDALGFSIDRLMRSLVRLGFTITLSVEQPTDQIA